MVGRPIAKWLKEPFVAGGKHMVDKRWHIGY